ncbi:VOC family protein [Peptoniphilus sp. MSJ-1]|uniref:VOC family protein n=1 Tax=Peptoniphilus ovalis TaxID=2841503 RepID=A0ABS6FFJ6_9FIRM|nr:VOC family protein [Peptoniphilus ovalis]MBU5668233.1 VOC family protein [Peptoniphilus ovalis]
MIKNFAHIGVTVTDLEKSIEFYRDVLELEFIGRTHMEGESTDKLFDAKDLYVSLAYLKPKDSNGPTLELIKYESLEVEKDKPSLFKTSISEICFGVDDIEKFYERLVENKIEVISEPQEFDMTGDGFGKSKAIYFYDPDGNILEAIEEL